jgi:hypothetical protein
MNRRVSPLACRCGVQVFPTSSHLALAMLWNIVTNGSCDRSLWLSADMRTSPVADKFFPADGHEISPATATSSPQN